MKKVIISIVCIILIAGGGVGGYLYFKNEQSKEPGKEAEAEVWNQYATTEKHLETIGDYLISANHGENVVKMTVNIELEDEEAVKKYQGLEASDSEEEASSHSSGTEVHLTPMQVFINSHISSILLNTDGETLKNVDSVEEKLKVELNEKLGLGEHFIEAVLIENYVLQ